MFSDEDLTKATIKSLAFALGFAFGAKQNNGIAPQND